MLSLRQIIDIVEDMGEIEPFALFEMANLEPEKTGIRGTIYISTQQGTHAARVKYYSGRPSENAPSMSISIDRNPVLLESDLSERISRKMFPIVRRWVQINYTNLMRFWLRGNVMYTGEVERLIASLKKWTAD